MTASQSTTRGVRLGHAGTATAWLEIVSLIVPWTEKVVGDLVIRTLDTGHSVTHPIVADLRSYPKDDPGRRALLATQQLTSAGFKLRPGDTLRLPFSLKMPWGTHFDGRVELSISIRSGVWNRTIGARIGVSPPSDFVAHVHQFAGCARMSVRRWELVKRSPSAELVPSRQPHPFAHARLCLHRTNSGWYGDAAIELTGNWPQNWLQAPMLIAVPDIPREPAAAVELFNRLLLDRGFDLERDDSLPIPAAPEAHTTGNLPTPAGPGELSRQGLPRVSDRPE